MRRLPSGYCHCVVRVVFSFLPFRVVCSCSLGGTVALCVIFFFFFGGGGGRGGICFSPFHFLLSYFLVSVSLMFMFRLKAIVGGLGNRCCR